MTESSVKSQLHRYRQQGRDAMLWKLDGLDDYDQRRPLTPSGTDLLGTVEHLAIVELACLGPTFGRPFDELSPVARRRGPADRRRVGAGRRVGSARSWRFYRRAWVHAHPTIDGELAAPDGFRTGRVIGRRSACTRC
jgi:hypothetical protein